MRRGEGVALVTIAALVVGACGGSVESDPDDGPGSTDEPRLGDAEDPPIEGASPFYLETDKHDHGVVRVLITNATPIPLRFRDLESAPDNSYGVKWQKLTHMPRERPQDVPIQEYVGGFFFSTIPTDGVLNPGVQVVATLDIPGVFHDEALRNVWVGSAKLEAAPLDAGFEGGITITGWGKSAPGYDDSPHTINLAFCQNNPGGKCLQTLPTTGSTTVIKTTTHWVKEDVSQKLIDTTMQGANAAYCFIDPMGVFKDPFGGLIECVTETVKFSTSIFPDSSTEWIFESFGTVLGAANPATHQADLLKLGIRACAPLNTGIPVDGGSVELETPTPPDVDVPTEAIGPGYSCTDVAGISNFADWSNFAVKKDGGGDSDDDPPPEKAIHATWDLGPHGHAEATIVPRVNPTQGLHFEIESQSVSDDKILLTGTTSVSGLSEMLTYNFFAIPAFEQVTACVGTYSLSGFDKDFHFDPSKAGQFEVLGCYPSLPWDGNSTFDMRESPYPPSIDLRGQYLCVRAAGAKRDIGCDFRPMEPYTCSVTALENQNISCPCFPTYRPGGGGLQLNIPIDACGNAGTPVTHNACPDLREFFLDVGAYEIFMPGTVFTRNFHYTDFMRVETAPNTQQWTFLKAQWDAQTGHATCMYDNREHPSPSNTLIIETNYKVSPDKLSGHWDSQDICSSFSSPTVEGPRDCKWTPEGI